MTSKICIRCKEEKDLDLFALIGNKNSFNSYQKYHTYCKACVNAYAKEFRKKNRNYQGTGRIKSIPIKDRLIMSAIRQRLNDARARCVKFKKPVPIITDLYLYQLYKKQNGLCNLSGVPLSTDKNSMHCLSLDQIDSDKGYIEGNVQWLVWAVNRAKGEMETSIFLSMCETILDYQKVQRLSKGSEN